MEILFIAACGWIAFVILAPIINWWCDWSASRMPIKGIDEEED
jgi:hypothetical protein